jgi:hypothetical protein
MLTRLKLTRGEGQLVEPSSHPSRRKHIQSPQVSRRHSPSMAHEETHERVPAEDEDLRKAVMEMREMMKILMERNARLQGEGSIGRLIVVIDVNPSHGFWTARLIKVFGHEGKCTCIYNTHEWIIYIMFFLVVCGMSHGSSWLRRNEFLKMTK